MKKLLRQFLKLFFIGSLALITCCQPGKTSYSVGDFTKVPKIDAHFHYFTLDPAYMEYVTSLNFKILSINVDSRYPVDEQLDISEQILQDHPETFAFLGTFSVDNFGQPDFSSSIIDCINECMNRGASGIKIWKNIGMELQDMNGVYVMADNPAFEPVFKHMEEKRIPLLAHLGEPRNCWLPLDEMTDAGDQSYYKNHPQYHMYLHPEMPSYEDQINARDNLLERYPDMIFIGAHLGSLEWNVDELAKRLEKFPNFSVDMAARIGHLRNQSVEDWDRVRTFMIKYQDRLLYATDMSLNDLNPVDFNSKTESMYNHWMNDWMYLATDTVVNNVRGLMLPRDVIDKIYYKNAQFLFH
jgi:predicted TIM-barrel fold metal-dependent hydrolase